MPTYQYACTECGHRFEAVQSFHEDSLTHCPECDGRLRKVFNAVGVVFKGSGFYRNDSRSGATSSSASKDSESQGSGSSDSGSSTSDAGKSDSSSTPAATPASSTPSSPTPSAPSTPSSSSS